MSDFKYISINADHINICIKDKIDANKSYKFKRLKFSEFESEQHAIDEALRVRDKLFFEARGVPFVDHQERQTNPSKNSRTGVVGVIPYVSVKKRKGLGFNVCTGFVSVMGTGAQRNTQLFSFKLDDPASMFESYRKAVVDAHIMRSMPVPSDDKIHELFDDINVLWGDIISDKIIKAQSKLKKAA